MTRTFSKHDYFYVDLGLLISVSRRRDCHNDQLMVTKR